MGKSIETPAVELAEIDDTRAVETASVEWRGRTFTFPADIEDWPADAVEAFEGNRAMTAVHGVLGDEQWALVKRVSRRTVRDVAELFDMLAKAAGFDDAGE